MADFKSSWNLDEWFEFFRNRVFLVRLFRRVGDWTPHELDVKDPNQSHFEQGDKTFNLCKIDHFIELPDGDVLLAVRYLNPDTMEEDDFVDYRKLSEVALLLPDNTDNLNKVKEIETKE